VAGNQIEANRSVASKITAILLTFAEGSVHSLTEIARLAGLPMSTAHRLATELVGWGLLERTAEGLYRVGPSVRRIEPPEPASRTVEQLAPWVLEDLTAATRTRARLGVMEGTEVAYIEKRPGRRPVTAFNLAATVPAHPTALGRALLAFSPAATVEMVMLLGLRRYTPHTITATNKFRRALAVTRLTKVALTRWEFEADGSAVAMPVFEPGGRVVAAIELPVTDFGVELKAVLAALTVATRALSRELAAGVTGVAPAGGRPRRAACQASAGSSSRNPTFSVTW
jgi:DNA-binding IclR family transcriptional regulator